MPFRKLALPVAVLLLTSVPLALAQGTYTQIDVPGAIQTGCRGIDTAGDIVGWYQDASNAYHGFLLSGGVYTTVDDPDAEGETFLLGMNDLGQFVGYAQGPDTGFLYDLQNGTFTSIVYPGVQATSPQAINDAGTIVGAIYLSTGDIEAFELVGSTYTQITPPFAGGAITGGITASGIVVGVAVSANSHGVDFAFAHGNYLHLPALQSAGASVFSINRTGSALVGTLGTYGFSYQNKTLQMLRLSGAIETWASGVNRSGEVVGYFQNASGKIHGFTWTPPAPVEKK